MKYIIQFPGPEGSSWFASEKTLPLLIVEALRHGVAVTVEKVK